MEAPPAAPAAAPVATPPPAAQPASAQAAPTAQPPAGASVPLESTAAPAAPATPEAPQPRSIPPEVEDYIGQLEQESATNREQADRALLNQFVTRDAERLVNDYGLTPENAQRLARERGMSAWRSYQDKQIQQGRLNAALSIGAEYGIDPRQIVSLPNPDAMIAKARELTQQTGLSARLKALEDENAALKKRLAPPQTFSSGQAAPDGTRPTSDNIDALYAQDPGRWEARYREFLRTGKL